MGSPEDKRVAELARRVRVGEATEAEREELALYASDSAKHQSLAVRAEQDAELGRGWLSRYEGDRALVAVESTRTVKTERAIGAGLVTVGVIGAFFAPPAGLAVAAVGAGLLAWSVLRIAVKTAGKDPYDDIEE